MLLDEEDENAESNYLRSKVVKEFDGRVTSVSKKTNCLVVRYSPSFKDDIHIDEIRRVSKYNVRK